MKTYARKPSELEFVRSANNYDSDAVSRDTALICEDESKAQQQFKEESDINFIADRFGLTGEMPQLPDGFVWGADFAEIYDFQGAQDALVAANRAFMELPAKLRAQFDNNPQKLLDFLADDSNREVAVALGLVVNKPQENDNGTGTEEVPARTAENPARPAGTPPNERPAQPAEKP